MKPNPLWLNILLWFACGFNLYFAYKGKKALDETRRLNAALVKRIKELCQETEKAAFKITTTDYPN